MDKMYCKLLIWSINRLVNRQNTYQGRVNRLNNIINALVDEYCNYTKAGTKANLNRLYGLHVTGDCKHELKINH